MKISQTIVILFSSWLLLVNAKLGVNPWKASNEAPLCTCDNPYCCPSGWPCEDGASGSVCCSPDTPVVCTDSNSCCNEGETCCGSTCCNEGTECCGDSCCPVATKDMTSKKTSFSVDSQRMNVTKFPGSTIATAPIAFYYDYFNNRNPSTNSLATPTGVEPVFGGNCGNLAVPVYIPSNGGVSATSFRMKPNDLCTCAEECMSVDNIINVFNMGIPYVHIDEVSYDHPCPECASIIQQVGDLGYGGRVIVFFRYSLSGIGLSDQAPLIDLAMKGYMRKLFFETYPSAHNQCPSYLCTSTSGNAVNDLTAWANVIEAAYPGGNAVFAPTYGLRPSLELDDCHNDLSAITSYFSAMHQHFPYWTGAAWFGAHECCACSGVYSYNDMAQHCAGLVSWWG